MKLVTEHMAKLDSFDGKFNQLGMWKIKSNLFPRPKDPPTTKKDDYGNLITAPQALKNLYLITYKNRLEHRKMNERYESFKYNLNL